MHDSLVEKWQRWCTGKIQQEVVTMHLHRYAWREVGQIIEKHGALPDSYYWEYMRDTYAVTQAVAVRRQADTDPRADSLGRLILEIRADAPRITRDFWVGLWTVDDEFTEFEANRGFDALAGAGEVRLDPAGPAADLEALAQGASSVKVYVDRFLAHSDSRAQPSMLPTLNDIHDAIDVIGELFKKYNNLLTASSFVFLEPAIQHDWLAVFRQPWIRGSDWPSARHSG
jgi:AbiU2